MRSPNRLVLACCGVIAGVLLLSAPRVGWAGNIPVPNGDFETLYKPGSTKTTATISTYTQGVGPGVKLGGDGHADYSDGTTGTTVDVPGWIGGGAVQPGLGKGATQGFAANGKGFGALHGETAKSADSLGTIAAATSYTLSAEVAAGENSTGEAAAPIVLSLLANGKPLTPTSSVAPQIGSTSQTYSNTYSAASLTSVVGQSLTIMIGVGDPATGNQIQFDDIQLTTAAAPAP